MTNISTPRSRRSGFTLIEVAIALAIFVFGALAIVQIFPPALGVIRNNEGRIASMQLGETMLARTAGKPNSVPDAIYDRDFTITDTTNPHQWTDYPVAVVGTPSKNNSLPANVVPASFDASALGHFKYIEGERHTVRINGAGDVKWVMLNHPTPAGSTVWVDQEEEIQGVQIDEDGKLDFKYAADSSGNAFTSTTPSRVGQQPDDKSYSTDPVHYNVVYYVSYKWVDDGHVHSVIDEPLWLYDRIWTGTDGIVAQGVLNADDRIIPGSVKVRYRQRLGSTVLTDPGASSGYCNVTDSQVVDASSATVPLTAGKTYRFSYTVSDWRWLVDDGNVPLTSGGVQLPIKNLDEQPVWGVQTIIGDAGAPVLFPMAPTQAERKNGTIPYAVGTGWRYRTVYRALDGWAQQLSVAAKSYIPFYEPRPASSPREPWREYHWPDTGNRLYFHPSEAGKSVSVSYADEAGNKIQGAVLLIDNIETNGALPTNFFGVRNPTNKVSFTVITDPTGNPATNVAAILSVQGLSVQARTAWQNADRYNQTIVPAYRTLLQ